ncbi:MFS transporter [Paenibacillus macerans]|uniref:MFS transporter n=1 Tax=Paenibacillus macerans TaxID=44252 RepID=UPI003D317D46
MNIKLYRTLAFIAIVIGFFMALLDATIVNVALPEISRHFGGDVGQISWIMNGFNLAFAVFILTASRLADQFGRKRWFLIGLFLFTLASLLAGFADSMEFLITLRIIQGLAGAIIVPVTIPLTTELFPKEMHGAIIGAWGGIAGLAAASGPALGGILTEKFDWQWIFLVNVPLGLISMLLTILLIKESYDPTSGKRLDYAGTISITGAMFCFTYALIKANDFGWDSSRIMLLLVGGGLLSIAFVLAEWKGKEPMLPLSLLKIRPFSGAALTLLVAGAGIMNLSFLTSFYLTRILGMTEMKAGLILSVLALFSMVSSVLSGPLSNKYGARWFGAAGVALMMGANYWLGGLNAASTTGDVIPRLAMAGVGLGLTMAPVMASTIRNVPEEKVGISSGVVNMTKALGSVLGVAIIVTVLQSGMTGQMEEARQNAVRTIQSNPVLIDSVKQELASLTGEIDLASSGASSVSSDAILKRLSTAMEKENARALAAPPKDERAARQAVMQQQAEEVGRLLPEIVGDYRDAASRAFGRSFKFSCWMLLAGVPLALISDRRYAKKGKLAESAAAESAQ